MPVGNITPPSIIYPINGIKIGVTSAGVRYQNRNDLTVISIDESANTVLVTTKNAFCASPVTVARQHFEAEKPLWLLTNTGNANAGTGIDGDKRALACCQALADKVSTDKVAVKVETVLPFSTGVIGETLNSEALISGLDDAIADLSENNWLKGANAILTTDIVPKIASEKVDANGVTYHITGMSKGSGMIRPNMATMLGYVATDAQISTELLQQMLIKAVESSFNRITVDGDMSTNDCCTLIATGKVGDLIDSTAHPAYSAIFESLKKVFIQLATLIVRDGEGASKFITVNVIGGNNTQECCDVAYAVAHSPLVKTAFFASDPNWGRILASVGYAGVIELDTSKISIHLDDVAICERGQLADDYTEEAGKAVMSRPEIKIVIDLGRGQASDTVYTCDLSHDYIKINADYRS